MTSYIKYLLAICVIFSLICQFTANPVHYKDLEFIILHNNDMHARFEQTSAKSNKCSSKDVANNKCYGGFARTAHEIRKYREEAKKPGGLPVLYLNAGDTYTGTPWFTVFKDNITAAFLNILQPDAISLGNHEFDEGVDGLVPFLKKVTFPVLAANLDLTKTPLLAAEPALKHSTEFEINGVKIGVIGYLTPETKVLTYPSTVEFNPEIEAINKEAEVLKKEGIKIIIALGHSGYDTDQDIARNCPDVDLVIGGHSNTFLYSGDTPPDIEIPDGPYPKMVKQENGKEVPVVQAYAYTKYLGYLKLKFDSEGNLIHLDGRPILINATVPQDSDVLQLLELYRPNITRLEKSVIGRTKVLLDGSKNGCRKSECNLGNLITDAMVHARALEFQETNDDYWTDASIAFVQGGGIRGSVERKPSGNVTYTDLLSVLPFGNDLYVTEVKGKTIRNALEVSAAKRDQVDSDGGFLQMSGVHVVFDMSKPFGNRATQVKVLCAYCPVPRYEMLDDVKTYKIILPSFLLSGGDGHNFTDSTSDPLEAGTMMPLNDIEALVAYIKSKSPIYPSVEWRIKFEEHKGGPGGANSILGSYFVLIIGLLFIFLQ